jgi:hypothetical protein
VGNNQRVPVTQKYTPLLAAVAGGKLDIFHDDRIGFDAESLSPVSTAKSTLIA